MLNLSNGASDDEKFIYGRLLSIHRLFKIRSVFPMPQNIRPHTFLRFFAQ